ncbi:hypothetical protein HCA99_01440 [Listeria booriae]|uniref:hypothetical protein n=1 Tax=Listeria booriae TaxID=1552123 RepID=UPI001629CD0E|nr:hypothetical protein [Listeria booriae]MBC2077874.1 hypothetical protein [Listeria booriae]
MEEKIIVTIPVYSIARELFYQKWNKFYEESCTNTMYKDKYIDTLRDTYFPTNLWKYNKIIGYIEIRASKEDIIFEIYRSTKMRFPYRSKSKDFIELFSSLGNHFPILRKNDKELKDEIKFFLGMIEKQDFQRIKNLYVDYSCFENFIKYFDLRTFIDTELK